jgi:hypothetical protein
MIGLPGCCLADLLGALGASACPPTLLWAAQELSIAQVFAIF